MSNPDLQVRLLSWIQDERHKAEADTGEDEAQQRYLDGMIDAYLSCFAKVVEMIDIAKERANELG